MVTSNISSIQSLEDLQKFVYNTICHDHELRPDAFPTSENVIRKANGSYCGIMFCLHGPRKVNFSAIWEKEHNRIFFYGPTGIRYLQVILHDCAPEIFEVG